MNTLNHLKESLEVLGRVFKIADGIDNDQEKIAFEIIRNTTTDDWEALKHLNAIHVQYLSAYKFVEYLEFSNTEIKVILRK